MDQWVVDGRLMTVLVTLGMTCGAGVFAAGFEALFWRRSELEPGEWMLSALEVLMGTGLMAAAVLAICFFNPLV